jgi:hypothetical protein
MTSRTILNNDGKVSFQDAAPQQWNFYAGLGPGRSPVQRFAA